MAKTDDIAVMLKTVINNLSTFRQEVFKRFDETDKKFDTKIDGVEARLTKRIDAIGKQLAYLEDDAPTREEFDNLEKKVSLVI
jgi:hypothetical protein